MNIQTLFVKAFESSRGLKKLNLALAIGIPFNRPHKLKITHLKPGEAKVHAPFIRKNMNHIKGMHACCLATLAEFTSGLVMLGSVQSDKYRLIMESIEVKYFFQGKSGCTASYELDSDTLKSQIIEPLTSGQIVFYKCEVPVHDADGNHVCTGFINWQIKSWDKVKTKA